MLVRLETALLVPGLRHLSVPAPGAEKPGLCALGSGWLAMVRGKRAVVPVWSEV